MFLDTEDNESIELKEIVSKQINNTNKIENIYNLDLLMIMIKK